MELSKEDIWHWVIDQPTADLAQRYPGLKNDYEAQLYERASFGYYGYWG